MTRNCLLSISIFLFLARTLPAFSQVAMPVPAPLPAGPHASRETVLAIMPVVNASRRLVTESTLLRDFFPTALAAVLDSSIDIRFIAPAEVSSAMRRAQLAENRSASDEELANLAKNLPCHYLLSWEPAQDDALNPLLRLRLLDHEGKVVYRKEIHSGANVAFYIVFFNLYRDRLTQIADDLLEVMTPGSKLFPPQNAHANANYWAELSLQNVKQALALDEAVHVRRQLQTNALALATVAIKIDEQNTQAQEAVALSLWLNGLNDQSRAILAQMKPISPVAGALKNFLDGNPPRGLTTPTGTANDDPSGLVEIIQARHRRAWGGDATEDTLDSRNQLSAAPDDDATTSSLFNAFAVDPKKYDRALAEQDWLWALPVKLKPPINDELLDRIFADGEAAFPHSAAIQLEKARLYDLYCADLSARNEALEAARTFDAEYLPAAQMAADLKAMTLPPMQRRQLYERLRAVDPFNVDLLAWTALRMARDGDAGYAQSLANQARAIDAKNPAPYLALLEIFWREQLQAIDSAQIDELLSAYPKTPELMQAAAQLQYENGRAGQALPLLREVLRTQPANVEATILLSRALQFEGQYEEAAKRIDDAMKATRDPEDKLNALLRKVDLAWSSGKTGEALAAIEDALAIAPENARIRLKQGELLLAQGEDEKVLETFLQLRQGDYGARALLEAGKILIAQSRLAEAAELANEAQTRQPTAPWGFELEAAIHLARGIRRAAFEAIAPIATERTDSAFVALAGARVLNELRLYDKALASAEEGLALRNPPAEGDLLKEAARAAINGDLLNSASEIFARLERVYFDDPDALLLLAKRAEILRDPNASALLGDRAKTIAPGLPAFAAATQRQEE